MQIGPGQCGQSGVTCYRYDQNGNLTQQQTAGQTTQYRYDSHNRLIEVQDDSGRLIARYGYDPKHRRLWKERYRDREGNTLVPGQRS